MDALKLDAPLYLISVRYRSPTGPSPATVAPHVLAPVLLRASYAAANSTSSTPTWSTWASQKVPIVPTTRPASVPRHDLHRRGADDALFAT